MMRRAAALGVALLAALPLLGTSCDENDVLSYEKKIVFDLTSVRFTAERHFSGDFNGQHVDWVERVRSVGDGKNIVVELLSRNGLMRDQITDPNELAAFDQLSATLATGGGPRALFQRDPAPDDLDRMFANYYVTLVELGREPVTPKGEPSLTYRIDPVCADRPFYVLTISTGHNREGFPLECQEYVQDVSGARLVSDMIVTSLKWGTPTQLQAPPPPIVARTQLASLDEARLRAGAHGLSLYLPKDVSLPNGFELAKAEEVQYMTDANLARETQTITLYRFVYSDGVEHIDFVEHAPPDTLPPNFLNAGNGQSLDLAMISSFGSISIGSLLHGHTLITIESRIAADRFGAMLRALVPL
jgi:hypothetical protein